MALVIVLKNLVLIQEKLEIKKYIKNAIFRILGIMLPASIFAIYLVVSGTLMDFISYAIVGIKEFANKITFFEFLFEAEQIDLTIYTVMIPIALIGIILTLIFSKKISKNEQYNKNNLDMENVLIIFLYSMATIVIAYPICDNIHFLLGTFLIYINAINISKAIINNLKNKFIKKYNFEKIKIEKFKKAEYILTLSIWVILFSVITTKMLLSYYNYFKIEKNKEIAHYKNIQINENLAKRIKATDEFIKSAEVKGKIVHILDAEAAIYTVPIDKYTKNEDMFLIGNIGERGQKGEIEKIKQRKENDIYLIRRKDISQNWQTPLEVIDYIRNNLKLVEVYSIYEIYK